MVSFFLSPYGFGHIFCSHIIFQILLWHQRLGFLPVTNLYLTIASFYTVYVYMFTIEKILTKIISSILIIFLHHHSTVLTHDYLSYVIYLSEKRENTKNNIFPWIIITKWNKGHYYDSCTYPELPFVPFPCIDVPNIYRSIVMSMFITIIYIWFEFIFWKCIQIFFKFTECWNTNCGNHFSVMTKVVFSAPRT